MLEKYIMVIREDKKISKNVKGYLTKTKEFTKEEKDNFRRKKLVEVRKGTGAGRPKQVRKDTSKGYVPLDLIEKKREKELDRLKEQSKKIANSLEKNKERDVKRDQNLKEKIKKQEEQMDKNFVKKDSFVSWRKSTDKKIKNAIKDQYKELPRQPIIREESNEIKRLKEQLRKETVKLNKTIKQQQIIRDKIKKR